MTALADIRSHAILTLHRIARSLDAPIVDPGGAPIPRAAVAEARLAAIALLRLDPADDSDPPPTHRPAPHSRARPSS